MYVLSRHLICAAAFLIVALGGAGANAHDLPLNSIMNAFVKVHEHEVDLVVRVPLDLLRGVPFPVRNAKYDVGASGDATQLALLLLEDGFVLLEDGRRVPPASSKGHLTAPSDRSFDTFEAAVGTTDGGLDPSAAIPYDSGWLDVHMSYPIKSPRSVFKIQSHVAADLGGGAMMTIRYLDDDGASRALIIRSGDEPGALNPAWYHAASGFVLLGVDHIVTGIDHLLFLFCLVIPFRRVRGLISVITAFTLAHSITLFASAFHLAPQGAWFPPLVEMSIAASIVYTAIENVAQAELRRRWVVAGLFGLVHGFGFSNALGQSLQFAGSHLLLSLFSFNVGIEIGQLAVLALMIPALALLKRLVGERKEIVILSALAGLIGSYWVFERWQVLKDVAWPAFSAATFVSLFGPPAALVLIFSAVLIARRMVQKR